jgi:choline dehydrogenase-like flavoprotein
VLIDARTLDEGLRLAADVVILGAGAAGIAMAHEFLGHPARVLLVESGGLDFDVATQDLYAATSSNPLYPDPTVSRLRYFGGSTNHWAGINGRFEPIDFSVQSWMPHSGWPITAEDLAVPYERAARYVGFTMAEFDVRQVTERHDVNVLDLDEAVLECRVGVHASVPYFGEAYRRVLAASGNVDVLLWANAVELLADEAGHSVRAVKLMTLDGKILEVAGGLVVVALGGIESPRLLLNSRSVRPQGLGNEYDVVGRYFMDHPVASGLVLAPNARADFSFTDLGHDVGGVSPFVQLAPAVRQRLGLLGLRMPLIPVSRYTASDGIESFHLLNDALRDGRSPDAFWRHLGNILVDLDMIAEATARRLANRRLVASANDFALYLSDVMLEQPPEAGNRVTLSEERDPFGYPRAHLVWRLSDEVKEGIWRGMAVAAAEFTRSGLGRARLLRDREARLWSDQLGFGHHHMGTLRMGDDPRVSVVDENARVHDVANLFVAGSAVFTTGSHVQPTLTIIALAVRLADELKRRLAQ